MQTRMLYAVTAALVAAGIATGLSARQTASQPALDADDIGGVVTSASGPEAGVWVIAETSDLPTGFRRIVVTDDRGRYVIPNLPKASYSVWVRGYGLVDSPKVPASLGRTLNLGATVAPDARTAARIYPANYWLSMVTLPAAREFPGTGEKGNGIGEQLKTQAHWIDLMKSQCIQCHQLGTRATREIPLALGTFATTVAAWDRRVQSSQAAPVMTNGMNTFGRARGLGMFADWSDRIAAGEVPAAPPRPKGVERNVVISQWDWADERAFVHDVTATDKRNPTANPYGKVYGNDRYNSPDLMSLDPVKHIAEKKVVLPVRDAATPYSQPQTLLAPSPYWGEEIIWRNKANMHNPLMDLRGRVWMTSTTRASANPAFCQAGSSHPSAKAYPLAASNRQATMYNPETGQVVAIDLCFSTHHLQFGHDADNTLWFSGGGQVIGWLNSRKFEETKDAAASQGWSPFILDTNGNGKRDDYVEPDAPVNPAKDKRIGGRSTGYETGFGLGLYGIEQNAVDGSVWGAVSAVPGLLIRYDPKTSLSEAYEPPFINAKAPVKGFTPRGVDLDRNGVVWTGLQSGHLASFDRRKCRVLNGSTATGAHCPEGWTLHQTPGPRFKGDTEWGSADMHYFNWVDKFDTFGLGRDTPFVNGTNSDSLAALRSDGSFVTIRVPYPIGFYSRGLDGRIDDANAGWKGRGLWAAYSSQAPWHTEGGRGTTSKLMQIQLRPDPLAR
ncbi:MAG: carboxypeptidase-like regulatory domain-containing protein [Vicinamibacterales bacterium]